MLCHLVSGTGRVPGCLAVLTCCDLAAWHTSQIRLLRFQLVSKMGTDIVTFDQCNAAKYSQRGEELGLLVHGHDGGYKRWSYKNSLAHCQQLGELTVVAGEFAFSELVSCRRASNSDLLNVPGAWVFSMCPCPHCCRSQILALVRSMYFTVCAFKARGVRSIRANLG